MIQLTKVCKAYGSQTVLSSLQYTFDDGSVTAVTGPSGCGKTTLLRLLAGLEKPDSGSITGVPDCISFVFQEDRLCPSLSAIENVRLVLHRSVPEKEIVQALHEAGLTEKLHAPVSTFSGGMKRRVAIVRAMLAPCALLLLDEPFKGLDEQTKADVISFVKSRRNNRTMIFVTHDACEAALFGAKLLHLKMEFRA